MKIIPRELLTIDSTRQRRAMDARALIELKDDIYARGLYHPPVVMQRGDSYLLVAGGRRIRVIDQIASEGNFFYCDKLTITPGEVPVLEIAEDLSLVETQTVELHENTLREELSWQDRTEALAHIHRLRLEGGATSTHAVAKDLAARGGIAYATGQGRTVDPHHIQARLREASIVAKHLHDPSIAKARNATEALHLVYKKEEKAFEAELLRRQGPTQSVADCSVRHGSLLELLPTMESSFVDALVADPPYGIGADSGGFRSRSVQHHNYVDTPDNAKILLQCIVSEGFRICRQRANLFIFCDIDLFGWLKETAMRAGWDVFRTPLTWVKSDSEGLAPWGRSGFRRTCEWILYATKGKKGLYHAPVDILRHNRVARHERDYGPEKPVPLLEELISCSTLEGDLILDPCCGSGSTLVAARRLKRRSLGIEVDQYAFNLALVNSQKDLSNESPSISPDTPDGTSNPGKVEPLVERPPDNAPSAEDL